MISKGSCDTEDWSNDAENSALPSQEQIGFENIFKYKTVILKYNNIFQNTVFLNKHNAATVGIKDNNLFKNLTTI